jgi:hypothetical protein
LFSTDKLLKSMKETLWFLMSFSKGLMIVLPITVMGSTFTGRGSSGSTSYSLYLTSSLFGCSKWLSLSERSNLSPSTDLVSAWLTELLFVVMSFFSNSLNLSSYLSSLFLLGGFACEPDLIFVALSLDESICLVYFFLFVNSCKSSSSTCKLGLSPLVFDSSPLRCLAVYLVSL